MRCSKARPGSGLTQAPACSRAGVPDRPGKVAIVVTATIDREVPSLDARMLSWGLQQIVSTDTRRVGVATQKFTIDVAP